MNIVQKLISGVTSSAFKDWSSEVQKNLGIGAETDPTKIDANKDLGGSIKQGWDKDPLLRGLQDWWKNIMDINKEQGATAPGIADTAGLSAELNKISNTLSKGAVSANLSLEINSQTSLMVDGRVLATIIKPYLYEDLLRFEGSAGTLTRVVSI
jgi:hypothetical protein